VTSSHFGSAVVGILVNSGAVAERIIGVDRLDSAADSVDIVIPTSHNKWSE